MRRGLLIALVLVSAGSACKKEKPEQRATKALEQKDFWPEAPKATKGTTERSLVYKPENIGPYTMTAKGGSPPSAQPRIDYDMTLALDLKAGATPRERDAYIKTVLLDMTAATEKMRMRLDHEGMMVQSGAEPEMTFKRGEDGPLDVAGMVDKPFTTLVFNDKNGVDLRTKDNHPFNELGGTGDMLDNALILFPDLPTGPVAPGHKWSVTHNTPVGATNSRVDITYNFEYAGDSTCPSGAAQCALLTFTASSKDADVESEGMTIRMSYGFAGKVFFNVDKGVVDESRVRMDMDAKVKGIDLVVAGTFVVKPA